jgi:hypothetical protein
MDGDIALSVANLVLDDSFHTEINNSSYIKVLIDQKIKCEYDYQKCTIEIQNVEEYLNKIKNFHRRLKDDIKDLDESIKLEEYISKIDVVKEIETILINSPNLMTLSMIRNKLPVCIKNKLEMYIDRVPNINKKLSIDNENYYWITKEYTRQCFRRIRGKECKLNENRKCRFCKIK